MKTLLLFVLLFSACTSIDLDIINLNGNRISVVGHGGMGIFSKYPMNSAESVYMSLAEGAEGVEIDCEMLSDLQFVAFHDEEMSGQTWTKGKIYEQREAVIRQSIYKNPPLGNYKVAMLEDIFQMLIDKDPLITLDLKTFNPDTSSAFIETYCTALIRLLHQYPFSRVHIELKNEKYIQCMRQTDSSLKIFWGGDLSIGFDMASKHHLTGITANYKECSPEWINEAHSKGYMVALWNTQSESDNRTAAGMNADIIQTDQLSYLLKLLD